MISDLALRLASARADARLVELIPEDTFASVEDAYRIQTELIAHSGGDVRGWKVTALAAADQMKYGASRPVAGPLLAPFVQDAPANVSRSSLITPLLECEIAFVLGTDLRPRDKPYEQAEIEAAIAAVVPAFELADSRVPTSSPDLMKLADAMGNGLFIVGPRFDNWRKLELGQISIALTHEGTIIERGSSSRILGNPLLAVMALANAQPLAGYGLMAGQIVTTGTCTTPIGIFNGRYVADFGPLGAIDLTVTP